VDLGSSQAAIVNLQGVLFLEPLDNPFDTMDRLLDEIDTPNIFVDFHAEATSEKRALGHYLTGRVTAVIGTHTHVPTADACILGGHTGYLTDVGMTGGARSVLGVNVGQAIAKQRFHRPVQFTEAGGPCIVNAVFIEIDSKLGICTKMGPVFAKE
jgi:calcineurin-like phosphoesterase